MNEKREFQRSESFAAAALLALSGGLLDAYTYLCRGGVFANAQTGNMVLLAIRAAGGKVAEAGRYLIPILAFAAGVMVAETVKRLHRSAGAFHWRHTVLGLEIVLLTAAACAPLGTWDSVVNVAVSFVCALQVEAFRKVHGHAFASTMCTGNLRSGTEALYRCVSEQAPGSLRTAGCYFAVIACFLCGAGAGRSAAARFGPVDGAGGCGGTGRGVCVDVDSIKLKKFQKNLFEILTAWYTIS